MPWTETCILDQRLAFVAACLRGEESMTALCAQHGISRKTGYKWLARWRADPEQGLADRSRVAHRRPHALTHEVAEAVVALRAERPHWGPKKLRAVLRERRPDLVVPAASTIGDLLSRRGLVERRRRTRSALPQRRPFGAVEGANDLWCLDFKGWFRTRDGARCDPLTVTDAHSRYLMECRIVEPSHAGVGPVVERLMREHGLPRAIRSDNGPPFAAAGSAGGLSRLSVQWLKLGIALERIEPGCPQQNGRHERMHATLKAETSRPPAASLAEQQARFDAFRADYNAVRPHEALEQVVPARVYEPSLRGYPDRVEEPWYDAEHQVRRVRPRGEIKWGGGTVFVSEALAGELVGLCELASGDWLVRFCALDIGLIERRTGALRRFAPPRPGRGKAAATEPTSVTHAPGP